MRFSLAAHLQLSHDTPAKAEACEKRQRTNRKPPGKREYQAGNRKHQTREGKLQERKTPNRECKPPYASPKHHCFPSRFSGASLEKETNISQNCDFATEKLVNAGMC